MNTDFISKPVGKALRKHKKAAIGTGIVSVIGALILQYVQARIEKSGINDSSARMWREISNAKERVARIEGKLGIFYFEPAKTNVP